MVKTLNEGRQNQPYGFFSRSPRFARIGLHPGLDGPGTSKLSSRGGPGQYNIGFLRCITKEPSESKWTRKAEQEEFSKYLGFRNSRILEEREFQKGHRGPGTYNIPDDIDRHMSCSVVNNKGFSTQRRFSSNVKYDSPPANIYFRNLFVKHHNAKKSFGKVPLFEWDSLQKRFKDTEPPFRKPPNLYRVPDANSLEALMKRVVSIKGPYKLFTGKRDDSSIKNHFSPSCTVAPDWFHLEPSDLDVLLNHPSKRRTGKFLQGERFAKKPTSRMQISDLTMCYRDPDWPGPGEYDLSAESSIKPQKEAKYAFLSSNIYQRPPIEWSIHPGPGRYFIKEPSCHQKDRPSWVFSSKTSRSFYKTYED